MEIQTVEKIKQIIKEKVIDVWQSAHDDYGHRYRNSKTGHIQRSVTTKLGGVLAKPHLTNWAVKMGAEWLCRDKDRAQKLFDDRFRDETIKGMQLAHTDVRDDAGGVGGQAHSMIERWLNDAIASGSFPEDITKFAPPNCDPRAIAAARGVEKLHKDKDITPIATEILVGDIRYSAGQLDYLCLWGNEGLTLVDWKSSNAVSQEYILQTVAYKKFLEGMTGLRIKKVKILHLSKDSNKYDIYKVGNFEQTWKAFKLVCGIYDWKNNPKNKLEKDIKKIAI